jgi:glucosyl-3-phosphoglycerate phosphatase
MMRLLLVRHGQSEWNAGRVLQGQADVHLSDLGRAQAASLAPVVAGLTPDRAVTSDLVRASVTAAILGYPHARHEPALREISVGNWQGRSIPQLMAEHPENYAGWRAGRYRPDGGEDWGGFVTRVEGAIRSECGLARAKTLLLVCHGGVIRAAMQAFLGLRPQNVLPVAPASLTILRLDGVEGIAKLELYNYRPEVPELGAPD